MPDTPEEKKPKPPPSTDQILDDIRKSNAAILKVVSDDAAVQQEQLKVQYHSLELQRDQYSVAVDGVKLQHDQLEVAQQQLDLEDQQLAVLNSLLFGQGIANQNLDQILTVLYKILTAILVTAPPKPHVYSIVVKKENQMAVLAGRPSAFKAIMQDNGNPITPPDGTIYVWSTDDPTDLVEEKSIDGSAALVAITVTGDDPSRTTLTATAQTLDPDGKEVSGSLTTDIAPGVEHTYTLVVQQVLDPSINPLRGGKPTQLPAHEQGGRGPTAGHDLPKPQPPARPGQGLPPSRPDARTGPGNPAQPKR